MRNLKEAPDLRRKLRWDINYCLFWLVWLYFMRAGALHLATKSPTVLSWLPTQGHFAPESLEIYIKLAAAIGFVAVTLATVFFIYRLYMQMGLHIQAQQKDARIKEKASRKEARASTKARATKKTAGVRS